MITNEAERYPYAASDFFMNDCLVIAPHPDDESIGCGGSIVKHVRHGSRVKVIYLTSGDKGDFKGHFGTEYLHLRKEAALNALSLLGVKEHEFLGFMDRELYKDRDAMSQKIEGLIRDFQPQLIYVPSPYEAHPDHRVAASIGWKVHTETGLHVCFYEALIPLYPNVLVDISEEFSVKDAAIRCYTTELHYFDYADKMEGLNRFRATTLSRQYAEAFVYLNDENQSGIALQLLEQVLSSIPA
jgi:LmbE family N-acetylglucosaminyl deacetylase